jgi:[ribosomal protein S18]-alanine N-acetyltransferase
MTPRAAVPDDAGALAAIDAAADAAGWSRDQYAGLLEDPATLGVLINGAGFALLQVAADTADVLMVAVDPAHRRQGLGRLCLEAALAEARNRGVTRVVLEVARGNAAARALYGGMGFTQVGVRKAYYSDGPHAGDDALVLAREVV